MTAEGRSDCAVCRKPIDVGEEPHTLHEDDCGFEEVGQCSCDGEVHARCCASCAASTRFDQAMLDLGRVQRELLAAVKTLPGHPSESCCPEPDLRIITECLAQYVSTVRAPGGFEALINGWDDMGDMDGPTYLYCFACERAFAVPADLVWR